jgi:hypothetical protein
VISQKVSSLWLNLEAQLFPPPFYDKRVLTVWQYGCILSISTLLFAIVGFFVKPDGFLGYDWYHYYSHGIREPFYPPWLVYVQWLTWPGLISLSCAGLIIAFYQRRASPLIMGSAFLSWPVLWLLFLGQLDGLVLLGLTALPWLTPLATLKPQISVFAFLASKRWLVVFILWILLTMLVWGFWPLDMFNYDSRWEVLYEGATQPQNISLWPWSIPFALMLLWLSRGDMDMLMLAGTFVTPHIIPYSYVIVLPAIARVKKWLAIALAAISWLPLSANWVGDWGWYLGHLFAMILWVALYQQRRSGKQSISV